MALFLFSKKITARERITEALLYFGTGVGIGLLGQQLYLYLSVVMI